MVPAVMAVLRPGHLHLLCYVDFKDVDARHKAGHDENRVFVIPGREQSERTRNPEVVARDSGFALTRAPE